MNKQNLPINAPCSQDWNTMEGNDRQRFCGVCDKSVHNLSAMTRREAQAVLQRRRQGQRLCVRYSVDAEGEIVFLRQSLIPAGLLLRTRQVAMQATLAAAVITAAVELSGCVPAGPVSGAITARAAAGEVAEQLGESGTCTISLEPVLPVTLQLHATACQPAIPAARPAPLEPSSAQPNPEMMGQVIVPQQNVPQQNVPPVPPPTAPVVAPVASPEAVQQTVRKVKKNNRPAIRVPMEHLMGDIATDM